MAARRQLARQRLLGGVVVLPGVEAQQEVAHAQLLDRGEERLGVLRPGTEGDPDAAPRDRPRVELARERPVAAADPRQRRGHDRSLLEVGAGVGQAHAELGEAAGVLVRLVGEVVPDDAVAHRGLGRRRRDVGVGPARHEQGFHAAAHAPQPVLRLVLPAEPEVIGEVDAARRRSRRRPPVRLEEQRAVLRPAERQAREVAAALRERQPPAPPRAVQIEEPELGRRPRAARPQQDVPAPTRPGARSRRRAAAAPSSPALPETPRSPPPGSARAPRRRSPPAGGSAPRSPPRPRGRRRTTARAGRATPAASPARASAPRPPPSPAPPASSAPPSPRRAGGAAAPARRRRGTA